MVAACNAEGWPQVLALLMQHACSKKVPGFDCIVFDYAEPFR